MAAARKPEKSKQPVSTPVAEWIAAGLGLVLTLGVVGYSVCEGLTADGGPPDLSVEPGRPQQGKGGWTAPIVVRNDGDTTAAQVMVSGVLEQAGRAVETRRTIFTYVPGGGQARGGLVFSRNPQDYTLRVAAEGYEEP